MKAWFLIIWYYSTPDAQVAVFKTHHECEAYRAISVQYFQHNSDVKNIECQEGFLEKDEPKQKKNEEKV